VQFSIWADAAWLQEPRKLYNLIEFLMLDEEENVPPSLRLTAPSSSPVPCFPVSLLLDCKLGTRARKAAPSKSTEAL
jgi:hypothetical protein